MQRSMFDRNFSVVTISIVAVIMHGSLYPYAFRVPPGNLGPVGTLIHSWAKPPTSFGDLVANILLYMPFGFFAMLALRPGPQRRLLLVTLTGLVLCTAIEITQFYDEGRVTNMSDVYLNTFGTWLGGIGGTLVRSQSRWPLLRTLSAKPIPSLLLIAMLGYHLFPYVPTIDLHKYWDSLKPIVLYPSLAPYPIFRYFALWLTVSYLIAAAAGRRRSQLYIPFFIAFVFGAKIFIVTLELTAPEVIGAAVAVAAWVLALSRMRAAPLAVAAVLCTMVIALRLEPFDFHAATGQFGWLPFRSYLSGSLEVNIKSFFEKFFLYGSLVWISSEAGLRLWKATCIVATLLFVTSLAEIYLPGRSAEITDAVMTLITGAIIAMMNRVVRDHEPAAPALVRRPQT